jgi:hypothetical protein
MTPQITTRAISSHHASNPIKSPFGSQGEAKGGFISLFFWQMRSLAAKSQSGSANLATLGPSLPMRALDILCD